MRRRPTFLAVFTAVLALAIRPNPICADTFNPNAPTTINTPGQAPYRLQDFTLTSNVNLPADPNSTGPQVVFEVNQGWVIVPPSYQSPSGASTDNPLLPPVTPTPGVASLNPANVVDGLDLTTTSPAQLLLGLSFNNGLQAGQSIQFALPVDPLLPTPTFALPASSAFVVNGQPELTITANSAVASQSTVPINNPEPLSVLIWSILAGLGLIRARVVRRSRPTPIA